MQFDECVRSRRSIRRYREEPVPDADVEALIDLARRAPSSMDRQPWTFIVVRDRGAKKRLAEIKNKYVPSEKRAYRADFVAGAAVIIVVCVDVRSSGDRAVENGVLAAAHILLGAASRGLGAVYLSAYSRTEPALSAEIKRALNVPEDVEPIAIVPLGYPDEVPGPKSLRPLDELIRHEKF
jgi:nitroreductase